MQLTILGTGHATATECFNTCFTINDNENYFLVDSGGGNGIIKQLKEANIDIIKIHNIFISHIHMDHILGVLWIIRVLCPKYYREEINDNIYIYGHDEVVNTIKQILYLLLPNDFKYLIDYKIIFKIVYDKETFIILNRKIHFFDIGAKKVKQFGFSLELGNGKFTFIGDETFDDKSLYYVKNSDYLFADAYMCGKYAEKYNPIIKHHHSTVKYISKIAQKYDVKNLILSHTKDDDLKNRKRFFIDDAKQYYKGRIYVPDDLEVIKLGDNCE